MNRYYRLSLVTFICSYFWYYSSTLEDWHFIDNINLIFHEAGHAIFSFFGIFIQVLMGSGFQFLLPLSIAIYFFFYNQRLSGSLCLLWVGQNLLNISAYANDAINMNLPLLGGDSVMHDWNYLLDTLGVLRYTPIIGSAIYFSGILVLIIGTVLSMYFAWNYKGLEN